MRTSLVSFAALLAIATAAGDSPFQKPAQNPATDLNPVTVTVVDRDSGLPVTSFTYQAWYDAPDRKGPRNGDVWTRVESTTGTFDLQAPSACRLSVVAQAPDYIGGYPLLNDFVIKSTDNPRRVVVRLRPGITVTGTVRDSRTKQPIAGATVAPLIHILPIWVPDEDKQVKTGADGRYEVRGVDPMRGVSARHPSYDNEESLNGTPTGPTRDILLKRKMTLTIRAKVVESNGTPLEGVTVRDSNDKRFASDKNGKLVMQDAASPFLWFEKHGFVKRGLGFEEIEKELPKPAGLVVVMERLIPLSGKVMTRDGRPVTAFTVLAGPGELPSEWDCVRREVRDGDGRFALNLTHEGTTWVGVAGDRFAAWERIVQVKRGGEPLAVSLSPGVVVAARVVVPKALAKRVKAALVPRRDKSDNSPPDYGPPGERLAMRKATLSTDGTIRFEHVRPDRYRLVVEGQGIPEKTLALDVPDAGLDMGAIHIDVPTATGRIEGRVWHPRSKGGGVWAFADGYVGGFWYERLGIGEVNGIAFQTDEHGRFKVDRIPVGLITVGFPYQVFDVVDSYTWAAVVVEGHTTTVCAFDPEKGRELTLAFAIGNGSKAQYESGTGLGALRKVDNITVSSRLFAMFKKEEPTPRKPMFRVELLPLSKGPLSFAQPDWEELDEQQKVVLADVDAGTYRLRIYDWVGLKGLESRTLFDREIVVPSGRRGDVPIALGAGCVTGRVPAPKWNLERGSFERPVQVTAVAKGSGTPSRRTRCDDDGNFCVRYLAPGTYTLFIHDPFLGYCRIEDVKVSAGVIDLGERELAAGATINGSIRFARPSRVPEEILAVGPSGDSLHWQFQSSSGCDRFKLAGFGPGQWTVSARGGDDVLARGVVNVKGPETLRLTLNVGDGQGP